MTFPDWTPTRIARIDTEHDRARASNGESRYGAYLARHPNEFQDDGGPLGPEDLAIAAWRIATPPVMSPPYVAIRPDLHTVRFERDDEEGTLLLVVDIPLSQWTLLKDVRDRLPLLADWTPDVRPGDDEDYSTLIAPHSIPRGALLTTTTLALPCNHWDLHRPTTTHGDGLTHDAQTAVRLLVDQLNEKAGPYVAALHREGTAR